MIKYFVYALQILLVFGAFLVSYSLVKKNKDYLGNRTLALTLALVGVYAFFTFIYKVLNDINLLQYAIRIAFISLTFALYLLFLTIQIMIHSSRVIKTHKFKLSIWFLVGLGISIAMIIMDWIETNGQDVESMSYEGVVFIAFALYIGIILIYSMIILYFNGIKKNDGLSKTHMISFFYGLAWMLLGLIVEGIGSSVEEFADLFDLLLFLLLSIGVILMAKAFLKKESS